jgi:predicted NBD/HSP70 family sugar kinase
MKNPSFLTSDGCRLSYESAGEGLPVVWQHGLGADRKQPADVFPDLSGVRRITLECRGHGDSELGDPTRLSIASFTEDVIALMDHLGVRKAVVGGISLGGAIALRLAALHPERTCGLMIARPAWIDGPSRETMSPYAAVAECIAESGTVEGLGRFLHSEELRKVQCVSPDNALSLQTFFTRANPESTVQLLSRIAKDAPADRDHDRVLFAANLPVLNERRLATEWSQAVHVPVRLERDSILSLMGEGVSGAARGAGSVLGVFFGTGVGAAFLQNNRPFRGGGWALEIGQMPFGNGRRKWDTSRVDCLEAYVSGRVLEIIAFRHHLATEDVFIARENNEMLARDLDTFVEDQANAVVTGVAMFSPELVVLGGGLCAMRGFPKDRLVALIEERSRFGHEMCRPEVRWATLGWKSVLYGAELLSSQKK